MFKILMYGFVLAVLSSSALYMFLTSAPLDGIKTTAIKKLAASITDDLDEAMPMIEKAGYKIAGLEIELSIPPEVTTSFELVKVVNKEKQEQILDSLESNKIGHLVLSSLMQAFALNENISMQDMNLKSIDITISLPPYVTIQYEK